MTEDEMVGWHHRLNALSLFTFMHWRRKWQPTPVCLPGESQGWGSLVGCRPWASPGKDTGVGGHALLQRIFLIEWESWTIKKAEH